MAHVDIPAILIAALLGLAVVLGVYNLFTHHDVHK